jgi:hypothetical protein
VKKCHFVCKSITCNTTASHLYVQFGLLFLSMARCIWAGILLRWDLFTNLYFLWCLAKTCTSLYRCFCGKTSRYHCILNSSERSCRGNIDIYVTCLQLTMLYQIKFQNLIKHFFPYRWGSQRLVAVLWKFHHSRYLAMRPSGTTTQCWVGWSSVGTWQATSYHPIPCPRWETRIIHQNDGYLTVQVCPRLLPFLPFGNRWDYSVSCPHCWVPIFS